MSRRSFALIVLIAVVATGCGSGAGRTRARRAVTDALAGVGDQPFRFTYEERLFSPKETIQVRGVVEDDLRSRSKLAIDGRDTLEYIVSDDALAVRVLDQAKGAPFVKGIGQRNKDAGTALAAGKWVVDHQGAPSFVAPRSSANRVEIGVNPILDASLYIFQYVNEAMNSAGGPGRSAIDEFNPDSIDYNPLDDPWRADAEADLVDQGIRRYDLQLPDLPRPTERGSRQALTGTPHFRKMVFYLKGENLTKIEEQILINDRPEFRRARVGRAADYYNDLLRDALAGATRDPVRQRQMEMTFEPLGEADIALPTSNLTSVEPTDLISDVSTLVPPLPTSRVTGPVPAAGSPPPSSPGATQAPAASPGGTTGAP